MLAFPGAGMNFFQCEIILNIRAFDKYFKIGLVGDYACSFRGWSKIYSNVKLLIKHIC